MSMIRQEGKQYHAIHTLIQLQELAVARGQQEAVPGGRLKQLDDAIKAMSADLPPDLHSRFERISQKQTLAIVPVSIASCSACGVKQSRAMAWLGCMSSKIRVRCRSRALCAPRKAGQ